MERVSNMTVNLYDHAYGDYTSDAEAAIRRETYGEDLGQTSWMTAPEWLDLADRCRITAESEVLEVGSGSGGPGVYLALQRGCRLTGVDINAHGVRNAGALAAARGVADRVQFQVVDASQPLPVADGRVDAIVANDAMCHIRNRDVVLRDWFRLLRPGGRACFTDALVITGIVSHEEIATRSAIGFYLFAPPGENERFVISMRPGNCMIPNVPATVAAVVAAKPRSIIAATMFDATAELTMLEMAKMNAKRFKPESDGVVEVGLD